MTFLDDDQAVALMKRAMSAPGNFSTDWPGLTNTSVAEILADGFATAQMQGWFGKHSLDFDSMEVTPDLSTAGLMLSATFAAAKVLRARLLTLQQAGKFKAGPVEADFTPQSNVLVALLKSAEAEIEEVRRSVGASMTPRIGDLVAVQLMGASGFNFESVELPGSSPAFRR